jgi:Predicted transmembrane transcriptional regulator (anti-sigma factor)
MTRHADVRLLLGAYVLGGLDDSDRRTVEAHLACCPDCRGELAEAQQLPDLLRCLPPEALHNPRPAKADGGQEPALDELLRRLRIDRTAARRRGRVLVAALAAVTVLAAAAFGIAVGTAGRSITDRPVGPATAFVAQAGMGTSGHAVLTGKPWGTSLSVTLAGLPARGTFVLEVTGVNGAVEQAATWSATPAARAELVGASSLPPSAIRSMRVIDHGGRVLAIAYL